MLGIANRSEAFIKGAGGGLVLKFEVCHCLDIPAASTKSRLFCVKLSWGLI